MSQNIHQIFVANPITSNTSTDLMYFGQSPYGAGNDSAMTYANFSAQFTLNVLTTKGDLLSYSTAPTRLAVGGTNGQILQVSSGAGTGLAWSTATYPATTTINQLLFSSAGNTVTGLVTANNSVLVTSAGGVPSLSATLPANISATTMKLTTPWITTSLLDTNGATWVNQTATASAVNYVTVVNNSTGNAPALLAQGTDGNVPLALGPKSSVVQVYDPLGVVSGQVNFYNAANTHFTGLKVATGQSTNYTATLPAADGSNGSVLQSNGSNVWSFSTATYPTTTTANQILYSSAANTVTGLATANSGVLVTNGSGVPSISTTLPSGLAATNLTLTTPVLGTPQSGNLSNCTFATGSWTPALAGSSANPTSVTYSFQVGEYTKVGNMVFYYGRLIVTALTIGGASGQLQITGLPFTAVNTTANDCPGTALVQNTSIDAGTLYIVSRVLHNTNYVNLMENANSAAGASTMPITNISSTTDITVSGFYFTS